ncbi:MAG: bidirectional hydrogenase complex protein HoxE [Pseudomonadota bacterium]
MANSNRSPQEGTVPPETTPDTRWRLVNRTMRLHDHQPHALIETLHAVQEAFGFLEPENMRVVSEALHVPLSRVYAVATFYHFFTLKPPGEHTCVVCQGTACYIGGAPKILSAIKDAFGIEPGETTPDGQLSLLSARCLGACGIAPAVVFDREVTGRMHPRDAVQKLKRWTAHDNDTGRTEGNR